MAFTRMDGVQHDGILFSIRILKFFDLFLYFRGACASGGYSAVSLCGRRRHRLSTPNQNGATNWTLCQGDKETGLHLGKVDTGWLALFDMHLPGNKWGELNNSTRQTFCRNSAFVFARWRFEFAIAQR